MKYKLVTEYVSGSCISLYPGEQSDGFPISQEEKIRLSEKYSMLFSVYTSRLAEKISDKQNIPIEAAKVLARRVIPYLTQCFLDRLIRIGKAVKQNEGLLQIPRLNKSYGFQTIDDFELSTVSDPDFNQWLIWYVGKVWELPESELEQESGSELESNIVNKINLSQYKLKNNLFKLYSKFNLWRILNTIINKTAKTPEKNKIVALDMNYKIQPFSYHGFYRNYMHSIRFDLNKTSFERNRKLRDVIFNDDLIECDELDEFLSEYEFTNQEKLKAKKFLKLFIIDLYPTSLLEGIPVNLQLAFDVIGKYNKRILLLSGGLSSAETFIHAAAKQNLFKVVNLQHGGHYGYIKYFDQVKEREYYNIDKFVSWGWDQLIELKGEKNVSSIGLPSPWLSERKRYWRKLRVGDFKKYDILFMSNYIKRFPPALYGPSQSNIDTISEYSREIECVVNSLVENDISTIHKPYNMMSVKLIDKTYRRLEKLNNKNYELITQLDKGLSYGLLKQCHIVLWDQPGTGFLECVSSKIPTMVCWPRIYSQEEDWVKPVFNELERVGVVHRKPDSLAKEIKKFKCSPRDWMNDPDRKEVIDLFCHKFARVSDDWPKQWRGFIKELSKDYSLNKYCSH